MFYTDEERYRFYNQGEMSMMSKIPVKISALQPSVRSLLYGMTIVLCCVAANTVVMNEWKLNSLLIWVMMGAIGGLGYYVVLKLRAFRSRRKRLN